MSTVLDNLRGQPWRLALIGSWLLTVIGGSMHPDAEASDSLRQELAAMTADERWVPGHLMISVGTALLALGLYGASRSGVWPSARRALRIGAVVVAVYLVETVMHLAAVVDQEALADGDAAPVAFTHVALAAVLYPVSGLVVAWVAVALGRAWTGPARLLAAFGVLGGLVHAVSVPTTLVLPDAEASPLFAAAGMLLALWSLSVGLVGVRRTSPAAPRIRPHAGAGSR